MLADSRILDLRGSLGGFSMVDLCMQVIQLLGLS
jgi:hypothetical protein